MSATYARVTPTLPCGNPNASRTDERPVQLTQTDGHVTRTDGHIDNPALALAFYASLINSLMDFVAIVVAILVFADTEVTI